MIVLRPSKKALYNNHRKNDILEEINCLFFLNISMNVSYQIV